MNEFLIIGLGNPGPEYELTRHNIGFLVLDRLADRFNASFQPARLADKATLRHKGRTLHLIKPSTFMNLSGRAVAYWMQHLNIAKPHVLVVVDDLALPFETLRMRAKGSPAGHNGLKSIEEITGGSDYPRLRMGISNHFPKGTQADYVLSPFTPQEMEQLVPLMDRACEAILSFCLAGISLTMSQFNN